MDKRWLLTMYRVFYTPDDRYAGKSETRYSGRFDSPNAAHDFADQNWKTYDCNSGLISTDSGVAKSIWEDMER